MLDDGGRGLLWRSLLWRRGQARGGEEVPSLQRIDFAHVEGSDTVRISPPSWSWMAYRGPIDYLDPAFNEIEWEENDIHSRWSDNAGKTWSYSRDYSTCPLELSVIPRPFDVHEAKGLKGAAIILDNPERTDELERSLKCVVLGRVKNSPQELMDGRTHYVLLVTLTTSMSSKNCSRVGVGFMPGTLIDFSGQETQGLLQ